MHANKIKIASDGNELTFVDTTLTKDKKKILNYQYTKSKSKKGTMLSLTEAEYENLIRKQIIDVV